MIVKVQVSLFSSTGQTTILITDQTKDTMKEIPADEQILRLLNGRPKAYYYADMDNGNLILSYKEAPWQQW